MKSLVIAAALALALPAFAAQESDRAPAQPPKAEKAAPAQGEAQKAETEKLASEGMSKEVTLVSGTNGASGNGASKPEKRPTLRFERWARDEDHEPFADE